MRRIYIDWPSHFGPCPSVFHYACAELIGVDAFRDLDTFGPRIKGHAKGQRKSYVLFSAIVIIPLMVFSCALLTRYRLTEAVSAKRREIRAGKALKMKMAAAIASQPEREPDDNVLLGELEPFKAPTPTGGKSCPHLSSS